MADYDRRPRRGGGGGGYFNNRKRRYRGKEADPLRYCSANLPLADDDFDDRRPQRRRYEEPLAITVRRKVLSLATSEQRVEDDVTYISKALADNYFDSDLTSGFVELVGTMTVEQPLRIPFIAAVILTTNTQKPDFTPEILNKISTALQKHIDAGEWRQVKLYMRLLGCLQGMFEGDGIFPLLEQFFERAADLQMQSSEDSLGLELVKIILLTIPYTMTSSATGLESLASSLLEKTDVIASTPHALESLVDPFPSLEAGSATNSESALALLQKHMQEEARSDWRVACLPRPWKITRTEGEEDPLLAAQKHPFPTITIPETIPTGPHPIYPEIYISVYADQDVETVPSPSDTSALIIRDAVVDTIHAMDFNRGETAKSLINLDRYLAANTFVHRGTAFDKVREVAGGKTLFKPEDVIVDGCFALLLALPTPEHKLVYYHSILTEACKIAPQAVAPSLGRAIRYLYRHVEQMDVELAHRFLDWFAHHLSNFGFTWKWTEWIGDLELSDVHPRKAFIIDALDKEIRLSFAQRIRGTLPAEYAGLISTEREKDVPDFKFNVDDNVPFAIQAREIAQLIRKKGAKEDFDSILDKIRAEGGDLAAIDVFVTAICWVGSKSLSHLLACVERSKETLLAMRDQGREAEKHIVMSILDFWQIAEGNGVMVLDKFLNYLVVTPEAVVESVLAGDGKVLAKGWAWEAIERVVGKVIGRVKGVVRALRQPLEEGKRVEVQGVLEAEMGKMRALFELIKRMVGNLSGGAEGTNEEERELVKMWAGKWNRAWDRRLMVEEAWVGEELAKPLPEVKVEEDKEGDVVMNGGGKDENGDDVNGTNGVKRVKVDVGNDMDGIE